MRSKFYYTLDWNEDEKRYEYNVWEEGGACDEGIVHDMFLCSCAIPEDAVRICNALEIAEGGGVLGSPPSEFP